jgi:hypothetical protein
MTAEILAFPIKKTIGEAEAADLLRRIDRMQADHPDMRETLDDWREQVRRRTASRAKWRFVMISPEANAFVLNTVLGPHGPQRSKITARLWGEMLARIDYDTHRVKMSRADMVKHCGASRWDEVASALAFLEGPAVEALKSEGKGRDKVWFVNPNIATHLQGAQRDAEQARVGAPGPLLTMMEGGKID